MQTVSMISEYDRSKAMEEVRYFNKPSSSNGLSSVAHITVLWDTANRVEVGKVLVREWGSHMEVDISWVLERTTAKVK